MEIDERYKPLTCKRCGMKFPSFHHRKARICHHCKSLRRYRITSRDYRNILRVQRGVCAICGADPDDEGVGMLVVDHDHSQERNNVRGLLCQRCNLALGHFGDSVEGIQKVLDYLQRPRYRRDGAYEQRKNYSPDEQARLTYARIIFDWNAQRQREREA